ncbi:MAG: hypothetical protein P1Q69_19515, partial [Candidatus Thorarchaeota archaeon]|nr:hypothetical protein [Candidatus Thorarchaeota archaeon]
MSIDSFVLEKLKRTAQRNRTNIPDSKGLNSIEEEHLLRASLNAAFFATAEKWMLPEWAIKVLWAGGSRRKIQDAFANDQFRNWMVIGGPGSSSYAIADRTGLTTILDECGSIDFWPHFNKTEFPALQENSGIRMNLVSVDDQMYEWKIALGPIEFDRLLYHVTEYDKEYIFNEIVLRNVSLEPQEFTFYVSIRPFSIRGVEPIESISSNENGTRLFVNNTLALIADRPPATLVMDTFDNPNLVELCSENGRIDQSYSEARGKGTAVMKYTVRLRPAGHENIKFASPLFQSTPTDSAFRTNLSPRLRDEAVANWFDFNDDAPKGNYPDEDISMAAAQAKTSLVIQARGYVNRMTPDELVANASNIARVHLSLSRNRCIDIASVLADEITQKLNSTEFTINNAIPLMPLCWAFMEMQLIHSTISLSNKVDSFIKNIEGATHAILLSNQEKQLKVDVPDPTPDSIDPEFDSDEDNPPSLMEEITNPNPPSQPVPEVPPSTLKNVLESIWILAVAEALPNLDEAKEDSIRAYREMAEQQSAEVLANHMWSLESSDDLDLIFDVIGAFALLKGNHVHIPLIKALVGAVREKCFFRGLLRYPKPDMRVSSYLRLRLANALMLLSDRDEVESVLEKLTQYLSEYYFLPEWIDITSKGGSFGDGCSLMAATDLRLLLRDILVYEKGGNMYVFPGIPEAWFTSTSPLMAEGIPTQGGLVNLETGVSANQHQIEIELESLPEEIEVFLPSHIPLHMVKVFGGSIIERYEEPTKRIRFVPLTERVALT